MRESMGENEYAVSVVISRSRVRAFGMVSPFVRLRPTTDREVVVPTATSEAIVLISLPNGGPCD